MGGESRVGSRGEVGGEGRDVFSAGRQECGLVGAGKVEGSRIGLPLWLKATERQASSSPLVSGLSLSGRERRQTENADETYRACLEKGKFEGSSPSLEVLTRVQYPAAI